jgi:Permuted papain-like amidase enzyme, YaeF/YiiX, C92 family
MKAGDVIFVRGTSIISRLVRFFDKGKFSHVAIAISETEVIETNWNMRSKIVKFHYEDYEIVSLNLTDSQRDRIPAIASRLEGKLYDYLQVIGYIFKSRLNNPRHLICSELVYNILSEVGYNHDELTRDITPNELYAILNRQG